MENISDASLLHLLCSLATRNCKSLNKSKSLSCRKQIYDVEDKKTSVHLFFSFYVLFDMVDNSIKDQMCFGLILPIIPGTQKTGEQLSMTHCFERKSSQPRLQNPMETALLSTCLGFCAQKVCLRQDQFRRRRFQKHQQRRK